MTVSAQTLPTPYTGDGVTVAFPTVFTFYDASEIQVVERIIATGVETIKTITTHYTVAGGSGSTGTVTAVTAPASTVEWHLYRVSPFTQAADYVAGDPFSAGTHEAALDKIVLRQQEQQEAINRSLKFPKGDPTALDATMPPDLDRANQYLGFDADGEPTLIAGAVSTSGVSAFMLTLLDDTSQSQARGTLDTFEDVFTTRGDILTAGVSGAEQRVALGSSGQLLRSNGVDAIWTGPVLSDFAAFFPPKGHLSGLGITVTSTTVLTIATGLARDATDAIGIQLAAALAKSTSSWVVGTGNGGMGAAGGVVANSTWYHVFLISTGPNGTNDVGFDTSLTAAGLLALSGYTYYRRIGSARTDGSAHWISYVQDGDEFLWSAVPALDVDTSAQSTTAILRVLMVPTGIKVRALINVFAAHGSNSTIYLSSPDQSDVAPSTTATPLSSISLVTGDGGEKSDGPKQIRTDTSAQIRSRADASSTTLRIATLGWIDSRGKNV